MTFTPVVYPQLVIPINAQYADEQGAVSAYEGSVNCAAAGGAGLANAYPQTKLVSHHAYRLAAGDPKAADGRPRGLSSTEGLKALKSYGVPAVRYYGESYTVAKAALAAGGAIGAAVDYGFVNDHFPELSGQVDFRGGHFWTVYSWTPNDPRLGGRNSVLVAEGLYDGRTRNGQKMPLGPQLAPFGAVRGAMGAFRVGDPVYSHGTPIGFDKGIFLVVPAPAAVPVPPVEPTPPTTDPDAEIAELEARLSEKDGYFDAIIQAATKGREI